MPNSVHYWNSENINTAARKLSTIGPNTQPTPAPPNLTSLATTTTTTGGRTPTPTMTPYLPIAELTLYISGYIALFAYGSWQLHLYGAIIHHDSEPDAFRAGWLPPFHSSRPQEIDPEWAVWTAYAAKYWAWFVCHTLVAAFLPARCTEPSSAWLGRYGRASIGIAFVACNYGALIAGGLALIVVVFVLAARCRRKLYVWALALACMLALNAIRWLPIMDNLQARGVLSAELAWEMYVTSAWTCLRLMSACLDIAVGDAAANACSVADVIAYVMYIPTFFYGPIVLFSRHLQAKCNAPLGVRLRRLGARIVLIALQVAGIEVLSHLFYVNSLSLNVPLCERMPLTALYAFGFMMGTVFYLKYRVAYGATLALAQFDGIATPNLPKFIGRVHLYSDMWKWFDHGLYEFLFKYIYAELGTERSSLGRKSAASAVTFAFIYLFHGTYDYVFVWCAMNYACVTLEMLARNWLHENGAFIARHLSERNQRRWLAIVGAQLFIPAVLANFFFFAGCDVGWVFMRRTYWESDWRHYGVLSVCAVCIFHTSEWLKRAERVSGEQRRDRVKVD